MDFGVLSHKQTSSPNAECLGSAEPRDEKGHGSTNLKHQRSDLADDCWKSHKMLKPDEVDLAASGRSNLWPPPEDGQMMLSFSSSAPHCSGEMGDAGRSIAFSISRDGSNSTTGGGGLNGGMRGTFSRLKGPFTPSQWMELEHQALIYKHIVANVPVPFNLLVPLKGSLYSYGSPGSYASNFLGWSPFHLGFSGSNDPEPGRCRRTDGKKWRCSRDAVPDQKYCERHINRGRHRSRKPVEGQAGHAVSGTPAASKAAPIASSSSASLMSSSNTTNSLSSMQHRFSSLQSNTATASNDHLVSSSHQGLSLIPPTRGLKSIQEQQVPFEESEFGIVSSDCLLNPSEKISYMNTSSSDSLTRVEAKEANSQHPVHHFIDDWPKGQSDGASASWAEELKYDWTQLSMSIPIAPDFSSSSSSPAQEKSTLSTLRLSHEVEPIHKSLGVSHDLRHAVEKQPSWSPPIIWGNSMGGPLGEVLTSTNAGAGAGVGVNFLSAKDCRGSPHMGSSPTGVLQKSTFVSLSNSGSSTENVSLCNDLLGPALIRSATIPSV